MHSRGVLLLERSEVLNFSAQALSAVRHTRDVGSAFFTLLLMQTWLTAFTCVMTIISIAFFSYGPSKDHFPLDLSYIGFLIILPCLLCLYLAFTRREGALHDLSQVKSGLLFCWLRVQRLASRSNDDAVDSQLAAIQQTMFSLLDGMRIYLLQPRFYATAYPYFGVRSKMVAIAQDRTRHLRRITACFKKLSDLCEGCDDRLELVHLAFERLTNVKEFRSPQPLRAMTRICIPVVIPVFVGPFWASYYASTGSFAFALLVGLLLNLVLVALLNVAIALEDPFDNVGLDGIYCDEHFHELEQNILMDADAELAASAARFSQARARIMPTSDTKMSRRNGWSPTSGRQSPNGHETIKSGQNLSFVSVDNLPLSTDP